MLGGATIFAPPSIRDLARQETTITADSKMPQVFRCRAGWSFKVDSTMFSQNCPATIKGNPAKEFSYEKTFVGDLYAERGHHGLGAVGTATGFRAELRSPGSLNGD
jgi:hypothetical protein